MPVRKVTLKDGKPHVQPCVDDVNNLSLCEVGRVYFAIQPANDYHSEGLYKLHKNPTNQMFFWLAMWNSVVWESINKVSYWTSIDVAIEAALTAGWIVSQMNGDNLKQLMTSIKTEEKRIG